MNETKILLVDDEQEFVETLAERLRLRELGPDVAYDGESALRIVDDCVPDIMILDIRMPGIDGFEVLRRVRENYPHVRVIILTGHGSETDMERANEMGAFAYLRKPVDMDELVRVLHEAAQQRSAA